jgi:hypothetical protein
MEPPASLSDNADANGATLHYFAILPQAEEFARRRLTEN